MRSIELKRAVLVHKLPHSYHHILARCYYSSIIAVPHIRSNRTLRLVLDLSIIEGTAANNFSLLSNFGSLPRGSSDPHGTCMGISP